MYFHSFIDDTVTKTHQVLQVGNKHRSLIESVDQSINKSINEGDQQTDQQ